MPNHELTHTCPVAGRVTLTADWKSDGDVLRGECEDCESAVYAERDGEETNRVPLTV
jgi:hypothetical protein